MVRNFKWYSILQAFAYCLVMTLAPYIQNDEEDMYLQYKTLIAVLVCIVKIVKISVDLIVLYIFIRFIQFFLSFRKLQQREITTFNKFILFIVMFLYVVTLYQSVFTFGLFILYIEPELNTLKFYFIQFLSFNVFYLKDFLIALMLSYLFYFKGMQVTKPSKQRNNSNVLQMSKSIRYSEEKFKS